MISRIVHTSINDKLFKGKAITLLGPRQVGKTTILKEIAKQNPDDILLLNGDDPVVASSMNRPNTLQLKQIIGNKRLVLVDEAQRIPEIGLTAKLVVDEFPSVQLIITGSSAYELSQVAHEPLTGRKWSYYLWPISWQEWENHIGYISAEQDIENRLVYGLYPDVLNNPNESKEVLRELTDSYLYKDVLMYGNIKKPTEIQKLLQALAYQIGNEVSLRELSEVVDLDPKTVDRYIDILEKAFVVYRLNPFSRNLRNEIKANRKVYFYDNGIRNALIGQFQPLASRQDVGQLWENFLMSERKKYLSYTATLANSYFWRTAQHQEVDYVEVQDGKVFGYEFKWNEKRKARFSKTFTEAYGTINSVVNRKNFRDFVMHIV
jgi:uncharacterized protein